MKNSFAALLEKCISASGLKKAHIASNAGISANYLARLISGDRHPSDQVVCNLSRALHLSNTQTLELLSAAGFDADVALRANQSHPQDTDTSFQSSLNIPDSDRPKSLSLSLNQLLSNVPESLESSFLQEAKSLLDYLRYKYVFNADTSKIEINIEHAEAIRPALHSISNGQDRLDMIAKIVGTLRVDKDENLDNDVLSTLDRLLGDLFMNTMTYQPQLIRQILDMLSVGAPWEIRRRIAEALPSICKFDGAGALHLMEVLRADIDDVRGPDIRRRVIESVPILFEMFPQSLFAITQLLQLRPHDDIYVALAISEACGDLQIKAKSIMQDDIASDLRENIDRFLPAVAEAQRHVLANWDGIELESLQFSMALHNLLPAPDTLLISLQEGLKAKDDLIQLVSVRYLERILSLRSAEALKLYLLLPSIALHKNVRRSIAKALPTLLRCLEEASLSSRALARSVILMLAEDPDVPIRRAVADHAMHILSIDKDFSLVLLQKMYRDADQAIRYRLRPVALCLAEIWLVSYAEAVHLIDTEDYGQTQIIQQRFKE